MILSLRSVTFSVTLAGGNVTAGVTGVTFSVTVGFGPQAIGRRGIEGRSRRTCSGATDWKVATRGEPREGETPSQLPQWSLWQRRQVGGFMGELRDVAIVGADGGRMVVHRADCMRVRVLADAGIPVMTMFGCEEPVDELPGVVKADCMMGGTCRVGR